MWMVVGWRDFRAGGYRKWRELESIRGVFLTMRKWSLLLAGFVLAANPLAIVSAESTMEEVIVTATKREESIQDVPIAVSAFTGEDLAARGVQDIYGLQEVSPSIAVYSSNSTSNGGTLRIRGVGTTGNNPGLEAAVGTFIDGVYRSRAGLAFNDLVDIDRVEILRGPQGTLFGKNTVAGALNVITKKPEFENNGSVKLGVGSFNSRELALIGNFVLSDDVAAARFSYSFNERDGYYKDLDQDEAWDNRDRHNVRGQLLLTPTDDLEIRVIGDYTTKNESCCPAAVWINGPVSAFVAALGGDITPFDVDGSQRVGTNYEPYEDVEDWGVSFDATWDINDSVTFRSITAYREFEVDRGQDIDFTNADILHPQDSNEKFENFSQEFQIIGGNDNFSWLAGAYVYTEDLTSDEYIVLSDDGPAYLSLLFTGGASATSLAPIFAGDPAGRGVPGQGYDADYFTETEGWSVFTHNTWHVNEKMDLTLGVRYSWEEKDAGAVINGAAVGTSIDDPFCGAIPIPSLCDNASWANKEDENEVTGTVKWAYQITDNMNLYLSYGRGYKAGGYNLDQEAVGNRDAGGNLVDQSRFNPETSDSYELGVKGEFLDRRLTVNSALFYTDFEDFQLNTFTGLGFTVGNVEEVTTQGVELESFLSLGSGFFATLGVTYADARYGSLSGSNANLSDRRLTQSPLWQGSASIFIDREVPNTDMRWMANLNVSHVGAANTGSDLDPEKLRRAFNLVNAQVGIRTSDEKYEIVLWGRNLGDKRTNSLVFDSVFQGGSFSTFLNPPRTYGISFTAHL